jgi:hypothetical protein
LRIHEGGRLVTELDYPKSLKTELKYFESADPGQVNNIKNFSFSYHGEENKKKRYRMCFMWKHKRVRVAEDKFFQKD